jgi:hypothetical protein
VEDIGEDEQAAGETDGEAEEIDKGDDPVFGHVAESDLKIIFEHSISFWPWWTITKIFGGGFRWLSRGLRPARGGPSRL